MSHKHIITHIIYVHDIILHILKLSRRRHFYHRHRRRRSRSRRGRRRRIRHRWIKLLSRCARAPARDNSNTPPPPPPPPRPYRAVPTCKRQVGPTSNWLQHRKHRAPSVVVRAPQTVVVQPSESSSSAQHNSRPARRSSSRPAHVRSPCAVYGQDFVSCYRCSLGRSAFSGVPPPLNPTARVSKTAALAFYPFFPPCRLSSRCENGGPKQQRC